MKTLNLTKDDLWKLIVEETKESDKYIVTEEDTACIRRVDNQQIPIDTIISAVANKKFPTSEFLRLNFMDKVAEKMSSDYPNEMHNIESCFLIEDDYETEFSEEEVKEYLLGIPEDDCCFAVTCYDLYDVGVKSKHTEKCTLTTE